MKRSLMQNTRGFTLVELLIVIGMLGVMMTSIYSIYLTHQRSAYVQEDVVEVQQNLKIALDRIAKDARMGGVMLVSAAPFTAVSTTYPPQNDTGLHGSEATNPGSDVLTLNVISSVPDLAMAWITTQQTDVTNAFAVDSPEAVDRFTAGAAGVGDLVYIMDPTYKTHVAPGKVYRVIDKNRNLPAPWLKLLAVQGGSAAGVVFKKGCLIIHVPSTVVPPRAGTIRYSLMDNAGNAACPVGQVCLVRATDLDPVTGVPKDTQIIATNITDLQFRYLVQVGVGAATKLDEVNVPADTTTVRAVRVTITGQTANPVKLTAGVNKVMTRSVSSVIRMYNKAS